MNSIVGTLESPGARSSGVASRTGDDGVGGNELSSVVVVGPSGSSADTTRSTDVDGSLDIIEQLGDLLIVGEVARRFAIKQSEASIAGELNGAIEINFVRSSGIEDVNLEANDVSTDNKVAVLDGNGGTDIHRLVVLYETGCRVGDGSIRHVVRVNLLAVDVDNDAVGGLDGEGKGSIAVEVLNSEGLSEVSGGSSKVAELAGLGLLPGGSGTALRLRPISRSRSAIVQVLVGSILGSDEVADVEAEVLGGLVVSKRAVENETVINEEDSEVSSIPAIMTAVGEGEGVGSSGSALRVVAGLIVGELALGEKSGTVAVLQRESHLTASRAGLDEDNELVVGIETVLNGKEDLSGNGLTLWGLG